MNEEEFKSSKSKINSSSSNSYFSVMVSALDSRENKDPKPCLTRCCGKQWGMVVGSQGRLIMEPKWGSQLGNEGTRGAQAYRITQAKWGSGDYFYDFVDVDSFRLQMTKYSKWNNLNISLQNISFQKRFLLKTKLPSAVKWNIIVSLTCMYLKSIRTRNKFQTSEG